jgi:hypothetical protein
MASRGELLVRVLGDMSASGGELLVSRIESVLVTQEVEMSHLLKFKGCAPFSLPLPSLYTHTHGTQEEQSRNQD